MAEIKFRAWHRSAGIMSRIFDLFGYGNIHQEMDLNACDVMQYTGLKDQNGKGTEMCQGDLVSASGHGIGEVQKNNWGEWVVAFKDSVETIHDLMMEQDLGEIVGTVHENQELLEVVE